MVFAAVFAYFCIADSNQCYSDVANAGAWGKDYNNAVDVTASFTHMSQAGLAMIIISMVLYYFETKFDSAKIAAIVARIFFCVWFVALLYTRFRNTGRACSGDYLTNQPANYNSLYLIGFGQWISIYAALQILLWVLSTIMTIVIKNRLEQARDEGAGKLGGLF